MREVSDSLWRERQLLELLQFKLEQERLLLEAGRTQWLAHATREVDMVLEQLQRADLERAAAVESARRSLGLGGEVTLRQLAAVAPEPWDGILRRHRDALNAITAEIASLVERTEGLLARGYAATRDALEGAVAAGSAEELR